MSSLSPHGFRCCPVGTRVAFVVVMSTLTAVELVYSATTHFFRGFEARYYETRVSPPTESAISVESEKTIA